MDLNKIMEIDRVIRVDENGNVTDAKGVHAPESIIDATWDEHGDCHITKENEAEYIRYIESQGWTLLRGWSGAYLAGATPIMHPSEYIGGGIAEHILENPGLYVALSVEILPPGCRVNNGEPCEVAMSGDTCKHENENIETEYAGWAVAFRDTTCKGENYENQATPGDHGGMCLTCLGRL